MEDAARRGLPGGDAGAAPTAEERKNILRARARKFATAAKAEDAAGESLAIVEFTLSGERYGIESIYIRETCPLSEFTPVPCTPSFVLGVMNVRGQVLSIVDLGRFFDLPAKGITDLNKVIVLSSGDLEFGILADEVVGVNTIPVREMQASLPTLTGVRAEYLKGVTNDRVTILDAHKILTDKRLIVQEEVSG